MVDGGCLRGNREGTFCAKSVKRMGGGKKHVLWVLIHLSKKSPMKTSLTPYMVNDLVIDLLLLTCKIWWHKLKSSAHFWARGVRFQSALTPRFQQIIDSNNGAGWSQWFLETLESMQVWYRTPRAKKYSEDFSYNLVGLRTRCFALPLDPDWVVEALSWMTGVPLELHLRPTDRPQGFDHEISGRERGRETNDAHWKTARTTQLRRLS